MDPKKNDDLLSDEVVPDIDIADEDLLSEEVVPEIDLEDDLLEELGL